MNHPGTLSAKKLQTRGLPSLKGKTQCTASPVNHVTMNTGYKIACALLLFVMGCAGPAANARKTEAAVASLADGAMKAWAVYYHEATNNPTQFGETLATIEQQHQEVNAVAKRVGAGLSTLDTFTTAYETNSATQPALMAAINAVSVDASQLANLIAGFTGKTNLFK